MATATMRGDLVVPATKFKEKDKTLLTVSPKEIACVKELAHHMFNNSLGQRKEIALKGLKDLNEMRALTEASRQEDALAVLQMEAVVAIVNPTVRKSIFRSRLMNRMSDERELNSAMQQHRDDFTQQVWKRRLAGKRDLRNLFQKGQGMISRLGDMLSDASIERVQTFERNNMAKLFKNAVNWGIVEQEDVSSYFLRRVVLLPPRTPASITVHPNRLGFEICDEPAPGLEWGCAYGSAGAWINKLTVKPLVRDMVRQTLDRLRQHASGERADQYNYTHMLARTLDIAHPSHQLQASVLAYPLYGSTIVKRRFVLLGYEFPNGSEDSGGFSAATALNLVKQIDQRFQKCHRFYFEISAPDNAAWRIGFAASRYASLKNNTGYPGQDAYSFGFGSDGSAFIDGARYEYVANQQDSLFFMGHRTRGVMVDLYAGCIGLVMDEKCFVPGFGAGSKIFPQSEIERQRVIISTMNLIPMFALPVTTTSTSQSAYNEKRRILVQFGEPFHYNMPFTPFDRIMDLQPTRSFDPLAVEGKDQSATDQDEEEKLQVALEKNYFRTLLFQSTLRCFSQFPPSVYKQSLAATRIQRTWRKYRGRKMRGQLRREQYVAATIIQNAARRRLRKLRAIKNESAAKIQKNWRRLKFIHIAIMRCIYRQPIPELHRNATIVQRKFRTWVRFRTSPFAMRYNRKIEDLHAAVNKIIQWWRPLYARFSEVRRAREKMDAATQIQRAWRGYYLRQLLRTDLREKLSWLGRAVARHKQDLVRLHAVYVVQGAWRHYVYKRVRADKLKTRNKAATRLQAFWKGYWVRTHIHLRFNYGQAVYLAAVCKALRASHFILKMYKPCGIVCPSNR